MTEVQITAELLAELDSAATAATPGPWHSEPSDDEEYCAEVKRGLFFVATTHDGVMSRRNAQENAQFIAAANPATILALTAHIRSLTERLEKAELSDDALAERMKAAGMLTIEQMMAGAPLDTFMRHAQVTDLASFTQWVEMRRKETMAMQARLMLDKREDHELFEWAIAHAAVFGEVHVNLKAAIAQEADHE